MRRWCGGEGGGTSIKHRDLKITIFWHFAVLAHSTKQATEMFPKVMLAIDRTEWG
jgi:hypothetical protein